MASGDHGPLHARTVRLEVPARPGYVLLARLALSAVCRLTPLDHDAVADLKLAVTEAASTFVGGPDDGGGPLEPPPTGADEAKLRFEFRLDDAELVTVVGCDRESHLSDADHELARAIIAATVDRSAAEPGAITLVKRLGTGGS